MAFWKELNRKLGFEEPAADDERSAAMAAAALLLEMTEADMEVTAEERDAVRHALVTTFRLEPSQLEETLRGAEKRINRDVSYFPQVETINDLCGPDEKERIVEQMWRVAFADGSLDKYEEHYLRRLCQLLHVPHRVFIQTRHRVEEALGDGAG